MIDLLATTVRRLQDGNRRGLEVVPPVPTRGWRKVVDCFPRRKDLVRTFITNHVRRGKLDGFVPVPLHVAQTGKSTLRYGVCGVGLRLLFYGPEKRDPAVFAASRVGADLLGKRGRFKVYTHPTKTPLKTVEIKRPFLFDSGERGEGDERDTGDGG